MSSRDLPFPHLEPVLVSIGALADVAGILHGWFLFMAFALQPEPMRRT